MCQCGPCQLMVWCGGGVVCQLKQVNDQEEHALELVELLKDHRDSVIINAMPYNVRPPERQLMRIGRYW
jgi:hypothetical protein